MFYQRNIIEFIERFDSFKYDLGLLFSGEPITPKLLSELERLTNLFLHDALPLYIIDEIKLVEDFSAKVSARGSHVNIQIPNMLGRLLYEEI